MTEKANPPRKQVLILGGVDWGGASARPLEVSAELNLDAAHAEYMTEWLSSGNFIIFTDWLREKKGATDSTIEEFWET